MRSLASHLPRPRWRFTAAAEPPARTSSRSVRNRSTNCCIAWRSASVASSSRGREVPILVVMRCSPSWTKNRHPDRGGQGVRVVTGPQGGAFRPGCRCTWRGPLILAWNAAILVAVYCCGKRSNESSVSSLRELQRSRCAAL